MRPIAEITDDCVKKMQPSHTLFSWEMWCTDIVVNGDIPTRKTYKHEKWIKERLKIKNKINNELKRRKSPYRLICVGAGQGLYLVDENDVAEQSADSRIRKAIRHFEISVEEWKGLSVCTQLSEEDIKMLIRLSNMFELQQNTIIGMIAGLKSLPPATKKRILKHLGIDSKKPKKKSGNKELVQGKNK